MKTVKLFLLTIALACTFVVDAEAGGRRIKRCSGSTCATAHTHGTSQLSCANSGCTTTTVINPATTSSEPAKTTAETTKESATTSVTVSSCSSCNGGSCIVGRGRRR